MIAAFMVSILWTGSLVLLFRTRFFRQRPSWRWSLWLCMLVLPLSAVAAPLLQMGQGTTKSPGAVACHPLDPGP